MAHQARPPATGLHHDVGEAVALSRDDQQGGILPSRAVTHLGTLLFLVLLTALVVISLRWGPWQLLS